MATRSSSARKYLPTLADLVDRLSIVQLKAIFIPERSAEYKDEIKLIEHDINLIIEQADCQFIRATEIRAIMMIMLANRYIWENEAAVRDGTDDQGKRLRLTHSVNGARNTAKNKLAASMGERLDWKVDCLAADLVAEYGNWRVFDE